MRSINPHCPVFVYHIYCLVIEKYKYKSSCICLSYILLVIVKYKYKSSCICLSYKLLVFEKYKYKSSCICLSGGAVIWQGLWRPAGHPHLRANPLKMIRLKHQQKETSMSYNMLHNYLKFLKMVHRQKTLPSQPFKDDPSETSTKRNIYVI